MVGIWSEDSSETSTCRMYIHSPNFLSELNCLVAHSLGVWGIGCCFERHLIFGVKETQVTLPCALGAQVSAGPGCNESGTLHPEAVTSYWYFQSSLQNRRVYQVGCDSTYLAQNLSSSCHVSPRRSSKVLIWTAYKCCMSSWNILWVININSLFKYHGHVWSFYTRISSRTVSLPVYSGSKERILMGQVRIIPLFKI